MLLTDFCGLRMSLCSTLTCISTSDPVMNSLSQIGHWKLEHCGPGDIAIAENPRVGLSNVEFGLVNPKVELSVWLVVVFEFRLALELALAFPNTEGEVKSK